MRKLLFTLFLLTLTVVLSANSYAQVSSAAVLFLRIAAGARAAAMGEAFVAVADDATTTHWNPAGLGTYPLSSKWFDIKIPEEYRPLKDAVLMKTGSGQDYKKYDLWAITPDGNLVKFGEDNWVKGDNFSGQRDRELFSIIKDYTGLSSEDDNARVDSLVRVVADMNNDMPRDTIAAFRDRVMNAIPDEYDQKDEMENAFIAQERSYDACRMDWRRYKDAVKSFDNAYKDDELSESEIDRVLFAVEKSSLRFNQESIFIPFDIAIEGKINALDANDRYIYVGTEKGMFRYILRSGKWQRYTPAEGLPATEVNHIAIYNKAVLLGTDNGVVSFDLGKFDLQTPVKGLPNDTVEALAVYDDFNAWSVIDGNLYKYDGKLWRDYYIFSDVLNDSVSDYYEFMKISGTPGEIEAFHRKFDSLNTKSEAEPFDLDNPDVQKNVIGMVDSLGIYETVNLLNDSLTRLETGQVYLVDNQADFESLADSIGIIGAFKLARMEAEQRAEFDSLRAAESSGEIGELVKVPYTVGFPYQINQMAIDKNKHLWVGTDQGVLRFDGRSWKKFGSEEHAVNDITVTPSKVYFATEAGALVYDIKQEKWERFGDRGLGKIASYAVEEIDGGNWFLTEDKSQFKGGASSELALMHVNWLPELADDIYYEFLSYVTHVRGWGTFGGNVTFLSYGNIQRTDEDGNLLGEFSAFDVAFTLSYGTPLTGSLSGGVSAKVIYSHLSDQGAGQEQGSGTSTGMALDLGLLYRFGTRFTVGLAVTNLGPDISYIDVAQSDPLPRNAAFGIAWKMIDSKYNKMLITAEMNKSLVDIDSPTQELKEVILNGGVEYQYGSFIAMRAGYIYDQEGDIKTPTLGFGLSYKLFKFDFAYIPSSDDVPLANTMRLSLGINFD